MAGPFIDLAPHGLDLTQFLLGEPLAEAHALFQRRVFPYPVDDGAVLMGRFESGALLSMNVAYNCPDAFPRRTLEVIGTEAMVIAFNTMGQTPGGTLSRVDARTGAAEEITVAPADDLSPFQTQVEAFSRCLLDGAPFPFLHPKATCTRCAYSMTPRMPPYDALLVYELRLLAERAGRPALPARSAWTSGTRRPTDGFVFLTEAEAARTARCSWEAWRR